MHELTGGCHCGNISLTYTTQVAPEDAQPRACQCSFCRKHQSRAISDPDGRLEIAIADANNLNRYQFGSGRADFLICRTCGVYVGAFMADADDHHGYATLMANALDAESRYATPIPKVYDGEDAAGKRARRQRVWTPAVIHDSAR